MIKTGFFFLVFAVFVLSSCKNKKADEDKSDFKAYPDVRITHVTFGRISDYVEMNATARYLKTSVVSSPIDGYILHAYIEPHQMVKAGQVLYTIQTKESRALGNGEQGINGRFSGTDTLRARSQGYVSETYYQGGDYVAAGDKVLTVKESSSLVFLLNMPYEWKKLVFPGMSVVLVLPDNSRIIGRVRQISHEVDPVNQTQKVVLTVNNPEQFSEGLIAKVSLPGNTLDHTAILPRDAVLANETETRYWVMKMINDSIAVKVPVTIGILTRDSVGILSPEFKKTDRILIYGNYAIPDTLQVNLKDNAR